MTTESAWYKSTYSKWETNCVEVANSPGRFAVRDTQHRELGYLAFSTAEWRAFLDEVKTERL